MSEWVINKLNYLAYAQNSQPEFATSSLGQVPGTYYDYAFLNNNGMSPLSFNQNTESYNQAQLELAKLYAARTNVLYTIMLNYIVTDSPNVQGYPFYSANTQFMTVDSNSNTTTNFFNESDISSFAQYIRQNVGKNVATPASLALPAAISNGWINIYNPQTDNAATPYNGIYYQYAGIRSLDCLNQYESFTAISQTVGITTVPTPNNQNCPAIYSDVNGNFVNQSVYIPNTVLQTYMIESNLTVELAESVTNNIAACNFNGVGSSGPGQLYFWHPSQHMNPMGNNTSSYMMCTLWNAPQGITPWGGSDSTQIYGAYSIFGDVGYGLNSNGINPIASELINPPSLGAQLITTINGSGLNPANGTISNIPMVLTAGDITGVPLYTSNNAIMNNSNNNDDQQTVFLGNTYSSGQLYFNTTSMGGGAFGINQYLTNLGYVVNLVHPMSEGLNLPIALSFLVYATNQSSIPAVPVFTLIPNCAFNVPVLVNSSSGMVPICSNSQNNYQPPPYQNDFTYYGTNFNTWGGSGSTNGSFFDNGTMVTAVSALGSKLVLYTFSATQNGQPQFIMNFYAN